MEPSAELMQPPEGYGEAKTPLAWDTVRKELEQAKQYWLAIPRSEGSPHVVPLDGMWIDDVWSYGGSPATVHRQLVAANPDVTMHLPDPWRCVVVEGHVRVVSRADDDAQRMADAFTAKYPEYGQADVSHYKESLALHPRRVLAWTSFPSDMTRFIFD